MGFNGKHLYLEDRKTIEENINKGLRKFETAKELNKSQSTMGKEIKNNRKRRYSQAEDSPWKCKHYKDCKVCIGRCSYFEEVPYFRRDRFNCCIFWIFKELFLIVSPYLFTIFLFFRIILSKKLFPNSSSICSLSILTYTLYFSINSKKSS